MSAVCNVEPAKPVAAPRYHPEELVIMNSRRILVIITTALVAIGSVVAIALLTGPAAPYEIAERYLRARYANQVDAVYRLVSSSDRRARTNAEYRELNPPFPQQVQPRVDLLASRIEVTGAAVQVDGDVAFVDLAVSVPNANDRSVSELVWSDDAAAGQSRLEELARTGELPRLDVDEQVELIREGRRWRVVADWASVYTLNFSARVDEGLPWEFSVAPTQVRVKPGETAQVVYRAINPTDSTITGKATHIFVPGIAESHTELIECFCFIQETLGPGEAKDMPLVLRLDWNIPETMRRIDITYEFYRIDDSQ